MNILRRFIYLMYYLKETDYKKWRKFIRFAVDKTGKSRTFIFFDTIKSVFQYNISILDYYYFRFFDLDFNERTKWAGTGYMYEYQLKMNPKLYRQILEDKIVFLKEYKQFVNRKFLSLELFESDSALVQELLNNRSGKIVLKNSHGQVGAEVEVLPAKDLAPQELLTYMKKNDFDLVEEYVIQHPFLMELSPTGLNTVRIFTQMNGDNVEFLGARLRISVNSSVDNMGAGNLAAPVDLKSGKVTGPAIYSDIEKKAEAIHPVSGKKILGFNVPYWERVIEVARDAAMLHKENSSIGWDIAITEVGVELIEGNHNWCKLLWQLPVQQGLKEKLEKYS